ncbi:MAG: MarR family winged helix-turn-helix transcriptional regulator [Bacillota bacterium]
MSKLPVMSKLGIVFLTWRRQLQKDMLPHKITLNQHYVLKQLSKQDFLYPSQIAEMLFCDRPTATVVIKNMEREGWIKREKDPENAKQTRVNITAEGTLKLEAVEKDIRTSGYHTMDPLECLTTHEKEELDKLLTKIKKYMADIY